MGYRIDPFWDPNARLLLQNRVKDDQTSSGGYRDIVLIVGITPPASNEGKEEETKEVHVCELQLTLTEFLRIKNKSGHSVYSDLRALQVMWSGVSGVVPCLR